jgi:hypothetical protein
MDTRPFSPGEIASALAAMQSTIIAELGGLPEEVLAWHPAPGEWCAKECIGHITEAERRGFNGRIRTLLASDSPQLAGWDQQAVARERDDCHRPLASLLQEFSGLRSDSVRLVQTLSEPDLERGGTHERVGFIRVKDLLHEWLHHDRNHFRQLQANVQAYVWPSMANCQKFAGE